MASFEIGSRSLFNFRNERFFLLVEDEITVPDKGVEIDPVNIYEIDQQTSILSEMKAIHLWLYQFLDFQLYHLDLN